MLHHRTDLGPNFSEAARLWWLALENEETTAAQAERRLEARRGMASGWLYGDRLPSVPWAARIHEIWPAVLPELWAQPAAKPFEPPAARAEAS